MRAHNRTESPAQWSVPPLTLGDSNSTLRAQPRTSIHHGCICEMRHEGRGTREGKGGGGRKRLPLATPTWVSTTERHDTVHGYPRLAHMLFDRRPSVNGMEDLHKCWELGARKMFSLARDVPVINNSVAFKVSAWVFTTAVTQSREARDILRCDKGWGGGGPILPPTKQSPMYEEGCLHDFSDRWVGRRGNVLRQTITI